MAMSDLPEPIVLGDTIELRNRVVMGSMTRNRCIDDGKPTRSSVDHYATRARDGVGLIVAEGTFISLHGAEWPHAPVMYQKSIQKHGRKLSMPFISRAARSSFSHGTLVRLLQTSWNEIGT